MKTVLFIAYYFPPAGGGGVQRPTKLVKYLRRFGWKSVVLTATEDSYVEYDRDLVRDIPEDTIIERVRPWLSKKQSSQIRQRTGTFLPAEKKNSRGILPRLAKLVRDWLLIPDSQILWVIPAAFRLRSIIRKYDPDVIIATAPPYSTFLLGALTKKLYGRPMFADFRDPWSQWFLTHRRHEPSLRKAIERFLEMKVLGTTDVVITVTQNMADYLRNLNPQPKIEVIYNGFDEEDFKQVLPKRFSKFTIVYTGKILENLYSPSPFLAALEAFLEKNPEFVEKISVLFVGSFNDPRAQEKIHGSRLAKVVSLVGYLSHSECIAYQRGAHALLLLQNESVPEGITGKIFEYLYTGKPILALLSETSIANNVLRSMNQVRICPPNQPKNIENAIEELLRENNQHLLPQNDVNQFSRHYQTKQLATMMDEIVARSDASLSRT